MEKEDLRNKIRQLKSKAFGNNDFDYYKLSEQMFNIIIKYPKYIKAQNIALFVSKKISSEISTDKLISTSIKNGKNVYVPRCITKTRDLEFLQIKNLDLDLEIGTFSLREPRKDIPIPDQTDLLKKLDIIFTPGMAFDKFGNRLGFGSAYYDKFLNRAKKINPRVQIIALAFDFQVFDEEIPNEEHDATVNFIITPTRIIEIPQS